MGSINRQSVREEAERIKAEFQRIAANRKIDSELHMLIQSMLMLINLLNAIFLEKTNIKNNKNSSKPSSQTEKDESSAHAGTHTKGKQESDALANNTRSIEEVRLANVTECEVCGQELSHAPCRGIERRTKIDIVFEKVITHVDAEVKHCPQCDAIVKGKFPADMPGPLQYGNGIKAYIINLVICQMLSLHRVQKLMKMLIGRMIAESSLLNFVLRLHLALEKWESTAIEQLLKAPSMNVDETSLRVDKKNQWTHVYSSGNITLKFLHIKRGKQATEEINIVPRYGGTIIHDCWSSYLSYEHCEHGLCGSHLTRELTFVIETHRYAWASNIKKLLLETCKKVSKRKKKRLTEKEYRHLQRRYRHVLTRGKNELPPVPPRPNGQRGKMAKTDAHNLWERLRDHEAAVLRFAKNAEVSFTNNRAERDLRMAKVKQKVSGCFRTETYAKAYCRISSYLQTMATKGYNPLIAIHMALASEFN